MAQRAAEEAGDEPLLLARRRVDGGVVALVTLNDPRRRNMMSPAMVEAITAAFDELEQDEEVGAVVVAASGPAFCAGADLGDLAQVSGAGGRTREEAATSLQAIYEGFLRVARCPLPTVAAVGGPAVGAGMNLALSCDVRLVTEDARFECRFGQLGLHPGGGHTYLLSRLVGPEAAAAMLFCNEALRGREIVERRLAWRLVSAGDLVEEAVALAGRAAAVPPALSVRMKASLAAAPGHDSHEAAVRHELDAQVWSLFQPFFQERLAALQARISRRPE